MNQNGQNSKAVMRVVDFTYTFHCLNADHVWALGRLSLLTFCLCIQPSTAFVLILTMYQAVSLNWVHSHLHFWSHMAHFFFIFGLTWVPSVTPVTLTCIFISSSKSRDVHVHVHVHGFLEEIHSFNHVCLSNHFQRKWVCRVKSLVYFANKNLYFLLITINV